MARRRSVPGLSFSWKRAVGISAAKGKFSYQLGIALTQSGRQRKIGSQVGAVCSAIVAGVVLLRLLA